MEIFDQSIMDEMRNFNPKYPLSSDESINEYIYRMKQFQELDTNKVSDGYHTFGELYKHRIRLFIALCITYADLHYGISVVWKSKKHSDGSSLGDWFIMGIGYDAGHQITYHLPMSYWDECDRIPTLDIAPEWDGHDSNDVLTRLSRLF